MIVLCVYVCVCALYNLCVCVCVCVCVCRGRRSCLIGLIKIKMELCPLMSF